MCVYVCVFGCVDGCELGVSRRGHGNSNSECLDCSGDYTVCLLFREKFHSACVLSLWLLFVSKDQTSESLDCSGDSTVCVLQR